MNTGTNNVIERVNALTEDQRQNALDIARERIAGAQPTADKAPQLSDYMTDTNSEYPLFVIVIGTLFSIAMLIVAFIPSAMRLYEIGLRTFSRIIADDLSVHVAAWCIVAMAEIGMISFSLAMATAKGNGLRFGFALMSCISASFALAGNFEVARPDLHPSFFTFLETFTPPVLVLMTSQFLKSQFMDAISQRHKAQLAFSDAHRNWKQDNADKFAQWQLDYNSAHLTTDWKKVSANALRDALRNANKQSKAVLRELTDGDWMFLVERERRADAWYERAEYKAEQIAQAERSALENEQKQRTGKSSGTSTHELDGQVVQDADGQWIATCPDCQRTFKNAEYRKAMNALTSHVGRWCVVRNAERKEVVFSANGHAKG